MRRLSATFMLMIFVDTIGAVSPFGGKVYMPSPRQYLATFLLWGMFGAVAMFGPNAAKIAGRFSVLTLLTATLIGPFGKKAIAFLEGATALFPTAEQGGTA